MGAVKQRMEDLTWEIRQVGGLPGDRGVVFLIDGVVTLALWVRGEELGFMVHRLAAPGEAELASEVVDVLGLPPMESWAAPWLSASGWDRQGKSAGLLLEGLRLAGCHRDVVGDLLDVVVGL